MTAPQGAPPRTWVQDSMFLAPALCCCGFLTFAPFLYMGLKAKRRSWLIAAAVYGAGLAVGCLIMTAFGDSSSETQTAGESVGATIILAVWVAGIIHGFIVRSEWVRLQAAPGPATPWVGAAWSPPAGPPAGPPTPEQAFRAAPTAWLPPSAAPAPPTPVPPPPPPPPPPRRPPHAQTTRPDDAPVGYGDDTVARQHTAPVQPVQPVSGADRTAEASMLPAPDSADVSLRREAGVYVPGDSIGSRFEVEEVLGSGGFSTVYRVRDVIEGEVRALKLFVNAAGYDAVRREIGALRKVDHPNVVKVIWADRTVQGEWYLIMEYVDGPLLSAFATGTNQLRDREAVDVALDVLGALVAIHPDTERLEAIERKRRTGELSDQESTELVALSADALVHRDIKPGNIILTRTGAKLLDFNIASRVGDPVKTISGTPPYQPPDGDHTRWDVSTDLFAVGITLYQLLCDGQHPYEQARPTIDADPRDPRIFRPDLDPDLAAFLVKACGSNRNERFVTAAQMKAALESVRPGR